MALGLLLILGILAVVAVLVVGIALLKILSYVRKVSNKTQAATRQIKNLSKSIYGTDNIIEGIQRQEFEHSTRPKSVFGSTSMLLPKICVDFPDFSFEEMKHRSDNVITSYLIGIDALDASKLAEGNSELRNKLDLHIQMLNDKNYEEHFERIKIHKTELSNYKKADGRCTVTFQTSIEYIYYITENGKIKTGRNDRKEQNRYETDLIYIQDRDLIKNSGDFALGVSCPHCGAPISNLGAKFCQYCDSPIVELNLYAWTFSEVRKID